MRPSLVARSTGRLGLGAQGLHKAACIVPPAAMRGTANRLRTSQQLAPSLRGRLAPLYAVGRKFTEFQPEDDLEEGEGEEEDALSEFARGVGLGDEEEFEEELDEFEEDEEDLEDLEALEGKEPGSWDDADRQGMPAADVGEPSTSDLAAESQYTPRPERSMPLTQLLQGAGLLFEAAALRRAGHDETSISGIFSNPWAVTPGSIFIMHSWMFGQTDEELLQAAVSNQAAAVVLHPAFVIPNELNNELLDAGTVVIRMDDLEGVGQRLADIFYESPSKNMTIVGITGTHGKTTIGWLVRGILEELGLVCGMMDSIEYAIGEDRLDPDGELWEFEEEDPTLDRECSAPFKIAPYRGKYATLQERCPGLNVQKLLAGMCERDAVCAVLECPPEALDQGFFDNTTVDVAVLSNIGEFLGSSGYFSSEDEVATAAARLFAKLTDGNKQAAVVNMDDPWADVFATGARQHVPVVTYSINPEAKADVYPAEIKFDIWETEIIIVTPQGRLQIITNLLGMHNVSNILAAVATGVALKAPLKSIVAGIEAVEAVPGRSEVIDEGQSFSVVVDAARTPEQLCYMIKAVKDGGARQIFTVIGASGDENPEFRAQLGKIANAMSTHVILTNENPRTEDPGDVIRDIVAGFPEDLLYKYSNYVYFPFQDQGRVPLWFEPYLQKTQRDTKRYIMEDRYSAIRAAIGTASDGDVVLLMGKGAEDFIEYGDGEGGVVRGWFDDRVEVRNALSKLKYLDQVRMDRTTLPWGPKLEEMMETLIYAGPEMIDSPSADKKRKSKGSHT